MVTVTGGDTSTSRGRKKRREEREGEKGTPYTLLLLLLFCELLSSGQRACTTRKKRENKHTCCTCWRLIGCSSSRQNPKRLTPENSINNPRNVSGVPQCAQSAPSTCQPFPAKIPAPPWHSLRRCHPHRACVPDLPRNLVRLARLLHTSVPSPHSPSTPSQQSFVPMFFVPIRTKNIGRHA